MRVCKKDAVFGLMMYLSLVITEQVNAGKHHSLRFSWNKMRFFVFFKSLKTTNIRSLIFFYWYTDTRISMNWGYCKFDGDCGEDNAECCFDNELFSQMTGSTLDIVPKNETGFCIDIEMYNTKRSQGPMWHMSYGQTCSSFKGKWTIFTINILNILVCT